MDATGRRPDVPAIADVNVLYLVAMLLLITLGMAVQRWSPAWGLVITELVVILLPALVFLNVRRLPVRDTLRLHLARWDLALLGLLIGVGFWFFGAVIDALMAELFGYTPEALIQLHAMTPLDALGTALGLVILAPICEEVLFRGVIQRGYERLGPKQGVLIGGLLFALYHLRFQGLLAVIPIAMILGYAFWRSQSLIVVILIHMSNNALGAAVMLLRAMNPTFDVGPIFVYGVGPAFILGGLALWLFHRRTRAGVRPAPPPALAGPRWQHLPLVVAIGIYLVFAGLELVYGRFPALIARDTLPLRADNWSEATSRRYELTLRVTGQVIGEAICEVVPSIADVLATCEVEQDAFDVRQGNSRWIGAEVTETMAVRWSAETLQLEAADLLLELPDRDFTVEVARVDQSLVLTTGDGDRLVLPEDALLVGGGGSVVLIGDAPWRLSALAFEAGVVSRATVVEPFRWQPELERAAPALREIVVKIEGTEVLSLPGGSLTAWRVVLDSDRTAWYAGTAPYPLVQYDIGILRWTLVEELPR